MDDQRNNDLNPGAQPETRQYIDWARSFTGSARQGKTATVSICASDTKAGIDEVFFELLIKDKLNSLIGNFAQSESEETKFRAYFTDDEIKPITRWFKRDKTAKIGISVGEDGLIAISIEGSDFGRLGQQPLDRASSLSTERADNLAIIISHMVRRALGDDVFSGVPENSVVGMYQIGSSELLPIPLEDESYTRPQVCTGLFPVIPKHRLNDPKDKLSDLKQLGPALEKALYRNEVFYFEQIANFREDALDEIAKEIGDSFNRIRKYDWISQARSRVAAAMDLHCEYRPTTQDVEEAQKRDRGGIAIAERTTAVLSNDSLARRKVRSDWIAESPLAPRNASASLAERSLLRRDQLLSAIEMLKRDALHEANILPVHTALIATIVALAGVFFGSLFSETLMKWILPGDPPPAGAWISTMGVLTAIGAIGWYRATRLLYARSNENLSALCSIIFLSSAVCTFFAVQLCPNSITVNEAAYLGTALFLISASTFVLCFWYENSVQKLIALEAFDRRDNGLISDGYRFHNRMDKFLRVLLPTLPIIYFTFAICLDGFDVANRLVQPDESGAARYDRIFNGLAWALPLLSFGVLITAWNRFGQSGFLTLTHDIILQRLKQVENLIRSQEPLVASLTKRMESHNSPDAPRFADMEKAANTIAPHVDLIKSHQKATQSSFVRRTALLATTVLALLQIDAFKQLEPQDASKFKPAGHAENSDIILHALFSSLEIPNDFAYDKWETPHQERSNQFREKFELAKEFLDAKLGAAEQLNQALTDLGSRLKVDADAERLSHLTHLSTTAVSSDDDNVGNPLANALSDIFDRFSDGKAAPGTKPVSTNFNFDLTQITNTNEDPQLSRILPMAVFKALDHEEELKIEKWPPEQAEGRRPTLEAALALVAWRANNTTASQVDLRLFLQSFADQIQQARHAAQSTPQSCADSKTSFDNDASLSAEILALLCDDLKRQSASDAHNDLLAEKLETVSELSKKTASLQEDAIRLQHRILSEGFYSKQQDLEWKADLSAVLTSMKNDLNDIPDAANELNAALVLAAKQKRSVNVMSGQDEPPISTVAEALNTLFPADSLAGAQAAQAVLAFLRIPEATMTDEFAQTRVSAEAVRERFDSFTEPGQYAAERLNQALVQSARGLTSNEASEDDDISSAKLSDALNHLFANAKKPAAFDQNQLEWIVEQIKPQIPVQVAQNVTAPRSLFSEIPEACGGNDGRLDSQDHLVARIFYKSNATEFTARDVSCAEVYRPESGGSVMGGSCGIDHQETEVTLDTSLREVRQTLEDQWAKGGYSYILVAGFADLDGTPVTNIAVSKNRALRLRDVLLEGWNRPTSLSKAHFAAIGRGEEMNARFLGPPGIFRPPSQSRRAEIRLCKMDHEAAGLLHEMPDSVR